MPNARRPQPDPYEVLGVAADASRTDIARAYRRIARALHPDTRPADPAAAEQFQALTVAYELLSDPTRRAAHDQRHPVPPSRSWPPAPAGPGPAVQAPWPLAEAPAGPHGAAFRTVPPGPALWAGPVIVEPATGEPAGDLADLVRRFLSRRAGRPW